MPPSPAHSLSPAVPDGRSSAGAAAPAGKRTAVLATLIVVAVLLAFGNSLRGPFVFDDTPSIVENPTIHSLSLAMFSPPHGEGITVEGRPVLNASLALNYAWGGAAVRGYHVVNLLIHLGATLLLFGVVRRTLRRQEHAPLAAAADSIAAAAALLWALHPLQTESVTYVVQRAESLMGFFFFATFYAFVRGAESGRPWRWFAVAVTACALGMGTKEVMVAAPLLLFLYDRTFVSGSFAAAWRRHRLLHGLLAATWLWLALLLVGSASRGGTIGPASGVTSWDYALCQARGIVHYLRLSVWPSPLVFDYGANFVGFGEALPFALVDLGLLGATAWALARRPALGFLGAWFFVILAPTSSVVGGTRQMLAEHRMYLSLAALAVLAAVALHRWLGRTSWIAWGALALALGLATSRRNADYQSGLALYRDTVAKRPENAFAHNNLGKVLLQAGRTEEALAEFHVALKLSPLRAMAHNNLAAALYQLGRFDESLQHARAALQANPRSAEAHYNLGTGLLRLGQSAAAIRHYEQALQLQPAYPEAACNLATALWQSGRAAEAVQRYEEALRIRPDYADAHYGLGATLQQAGRWEAARAHYETALRLRPDFPEVHNNLGVALARRGAAREAIEHYRTALRLRPDYVEAHANLGEALAAQGQWPEAIAELEAALRLKADYVPARFQLGNALAASGHPAQAIPHYEAAVRAEPDNPEYHNNLGSALLEGAQRLDEAIAQFEIVLRLRPDSAEAHCNLGVALADRGERAQAIAHLEAAVRLKPDYAFAREELAKLRPASRR